jgi:hypothetical protein
MTTDSISGQRGPEKGHTGSPADLHASQLAPETFAFYRRMVQKLTASEVPFLVGGAYALAHYTGIVRHAKDFDIFVRRADAVHVLDILGRAGCDTDLSFPHWLGKAYCGDDYIDIIFNSGNGLAAVDDEWFAWAIPDEVFGIPVKLCPPEEIVWSKAFVMERERFDGADVNHLLLHMAERLDWQRLLRRFGENWPILLTHLLMFRFAYPSDAHRVPQSVMTDLLSRASAIDPQEAGERKLSRGTLLSREQYLVDINEWGFRDARLEPIGSMTEQEVKAWTDALGTKLMIERREGLHRRECQAQDVCPADD